MTRFTCVMPFVVAILWMTSTSHAQDWFVFAKPMITRPDVDKIIATLNLTDDQQSQVRSAFDSYWSAFGVAIQNAKATSAQMTTHAAKLGVEFSLQCWETRIRLETKFESDVKVSLSEVSQQESWRRGIAAARRRCALNEMHAERTLEHGCDLIATLDSVGITDDERRATDDAVRAYETEMDEALRFFLTERPPLYRLNFELSDPAANAPGNDSDKPKKQKVALERFYANVKHISDLNNATAPRIADALSPEHREAFLAAVYRRDFPYAFETCPAQLAMEALRQVPDIAADKRAALESVFAEYAPVRDALLKQIVDVIRQCGLNDNPLKREMTDVWRRVEAGELTQEESYKLHGELAARHPASPLFRRRHDLALETVHRMRNVFTEDEVQKLPPALQLCLTTW